MKRNDSVSYRSTEKSRENFPPFQPRSQKQKPHLCNTSTPKNPQISSFSQNPNIMDTDGLSLICSGLGAIEEDDEGKRIGYSKGEYCLGMNDPVSFLFFSFLDSI
jgi:hypothetical protein